MARSEAQKKADAKYQKEKTTVKTVKFFNSNDEDILQYIKSKKSFNAYVKDLIRKDMKENQE